MSPFRPSAFIREIRGAQPGSAHFTDPSVTSFSEQIEGIHVHSVGAGRD